MTRRFAHHHLLVGVILAAMAGVATLGVTLGPGLLAQPSLRPVSAIQRTGVAVTPTAAMGMGSTDGPAGGSGGYQPSPGSMTGPGGAMMGGGLAATMMGGAGMGKVMGSVQLTSPTVVHQQIAQASSTAQLDGSRGQISYRTRQVSLVMVGGPPGRPGMYWQTDGLVNPTVVVPAGATITVHFADGDPGTIHGWELTAGAPPYPTMAMMAGQPVPGAFAMPVLPPSGSTWYGRTLRFTAPAPGTYHYLCPVPGHAAAGMWGTLVVR